MLNKLLIIEDNKYKLTKISNFIREFSETIEIVEAYSYTSGWQKIVEGTFDLIVLDMSLPTFDIGETQSGGNFRTFGGKEIVRRMDRGNKLTNFLIITQYETFNDVTGTRSLASMDKELEELYRENFKGIIHLDSSSNNWKVKLNNILENSQ